MDNFKIDTSMQSGYLKHLLNQKGVTDLNTISDYMQELKDLQCKEDIFSYERFTKEGSSSAATIVTHYNQQEKDCIFWCANHYLGLNRNKRIMEKAKEAIDKFGTGCGTSAMSGGMSTLHKEIEGRVARMTNKESAILFPTGYSTNLGAISSLAGKKDLLLVDRESHASIIDGCKLSGARYFPFRHNEVSDLESSLKELSRDYENTFVIVETAYSMSGDIAPLREIVELKRKYKFYLFVDEAHTFGFYGENGSGLCNELGVIDDVDFIMSTLSKGTASLGGFVSTKKKYCTFMQLNCNSYIFQACLTPADAATVLACLDEIEENPELSKELHKNNVYFRNKLTGLGFNLGNSKSPIVPIYIRDTKTLYNFEKELYENGIFTVAIVFPAVKVTEGRLRFIVTRSHSIEQIDKTVDVLAHLGEKYNIL